MDNQDEWIAQIKRLDANKVVIGLVIVAAVGILVQAVLLYLFF